MLEVIAKNPSSKAGTFSQIARYLFRACKTNLERINHSRVNHEFWLIGINRSILNLDFVARHRGDSKLVKITRSRQATILTRTFHAAARLATNHDEVFTFNTTLSRFVTFYMHLTCDHFSIDPDTQEAITPLTRNQIPVILELNRSLYIVVNISMVP